MLRGDITVLDCTVRDGGLINRHRFDHRFVASAYRALSDAGVDWIEIGYRNSAQVFSSDEYGPWMFSGDGDIGRVIETSGEGAGLAVMVDVGRFDPADFKPAAESPVDMVRTATYVKDIPRAVGASRLFHELGYETTINIMAISRDLTAVDLDDGLHMIEEESPASVVYIVDSFGSLYPQMAGELVSRFGSILTTKKVGFHGHNHLQLAFANTIEAIRQGATFADGTVFGIGRAAGNCPIELLLGYIRHERFDIGPVLDLIADEFVPLRREIEWGYIIPYAISGMLNEHPRAAMALRNSPDRDRYREFYDRMSSGCMD